MKAIHTYVLLLLAFSLVSLKALAINTTTFNFKKVSCTGSYNNRSANAIFLVNDPGATIDLVIYSTVSSKVLGHYLIKKTNANLLYHSPFVAELYTGIAVSANGQVLPERQIELSLYYYRSQPSSVISLYLNHALIEKTEFICRYTEHSADPSITGSNE